MVAPNYAEKAERLLKAAEETSDTEQAQVLATMAVAYATLAVSTSKGGAQS